MESWPGPGFSPSRATYSAPMQAIPEPINRPECITSRGQTAMQLCMRPAGAAPRRDGTPKARAGGGGRSYRGHCGYGPLMRAGNEAVQGPDQSKDQTLHPPCRSGAPAAMGHQKLAPGRRSYRHHNGVGRSCAPEMKLSKAPIHPKIKRCTHPVGAAPSPRWDTKSSRRGRRSYRRPNGEGRRCGPEMKLFEGPINWRPETIVNGYPGL